ncbi:MAG TPA: hypothetical protein VKB93_16985 [Thermoanaerobaculia bacterium]|nr:hypothetical protein [Thermoanaerobaculia bacterium]
MNTWQILILNILVLLSTPQQTPKPLTPEQQQQFEVAFKAGNFKVPASML